MYGWTGKILRVNLTDSTAKTESDTAYQDTFVGGIGFGEKLYWDEVPADIGAYDPANKVYIMPGPGAGTMMPSAGRIEFMGKSLHPYSEGVVEKLGQFCRGGAGGWFAPELKFAGYDGLVLEGKASKPVYLWILDDKVEFRDAKELWGWGTFLTNSKIRAELGRDDIEVAAIGQAGENLADTATVQIGRNSIGQAGMGAVMGSKNIKAVAVKGTGTVPVADPDGLMDIWLGLRNWLTDAKVNTSNFRPASTPAKLKSQAAGTNDGLAPYGYRRMTCSASCPAACADTATNIPSPTGGPNEAFQRCSTNVQVWLSGHVDDTAYGPYTRSSLRAVSNDWGINLYEVGLGIVTWLRFCANADLIHDIGGVVPLKIPENARNYPGTDPVHPNADNIHVDASSLPAHGRDSYESTYAMMKAIAFKEGDLGRILGKGSIRASKELGWGEDLLKICYHKDGFNDHCGSRWSHDHHFPFWITAALTRAIWHRDSSDSIHHGMGCSLGSLPQEYGGPWSWDQCAAASQHLWGENYFSRDYNGKEKTTYWYMRDCSFCCSLVLCDWLYQYTRMGPPNGVGIATTPKGKTFETQEMPYLVYNAVTGKSIDKTEQLKIGERIHVLERAIYIREGHIGRKGDWFTKADEAVIPYYVRWGDSYDHIHLDPVQFRALMDRYYAVAGWDPNTGRPKRAKYDELGLGYVADALAKLGPDKVPS